MILVCFVFGCNGHSATTPVCRLQALQQVLCVGVKMKGRICLKRRGMAGGYLSPKAAMAAVNHGCRSLVGL